MHPADLARHLRDQGVAPDVAAGCSVKHAGAWRTDVGGDVATYFDLASLTKPMTAVAVARSPLARGDCLGDLVPDFHATQSRDASLELLLSHRAGLTAHIPIFQPLVSGGTVDPLLALCVAADSRRADARGDYPAEGFAPVYSDLGYALAGHALARHTATRDAGEALERLVVGPLGLTGQLGTARELAFGARRDEVRVAPTEDVPWRGGLVRGQVHDENAWALTGLGGSGHAGMFGTISAVLRFGEAVLDSLEGSGPFAAVDLRWLVAPRPGGTLRAGFDGKSITGSSAGERFGARSFGHLGFTGTSLWIDPDARIVAVLLTNRVSPTRANEALKKARPFAHDALHAHASALSV